MTACSSAVSAETLNKVESKIFIKRMLAIGISNIAYVRNLLPEVAFSDRAYEGLPLKILKEQGHEGANQIVNWMKGVYDALEHEYLRVLIFAIMKDPEDANSVIETYSFGFTYQDGSIHASVKVGDKDPKPTGILTKQKTKESAKQMLRNLIILTNNLDDLPENVVMTVRLLYYDQVTPKDYQPQCFMEAAEKDSLKFATDNVRIKIGQVLTPYATMKLRARAGKRQFEGEDNVTSKPSAINRSLDVSYEDCNLSQATTTNIAMPENKNSAAGKNIISSEIKAHSGESSSGGEMDDGGLGVRCPCGDKDDDGTMILCSRCNYWQHAICFCVPDNSKTPENHACHICSEKVNVLCTDPRLPGLSKPRQRELCSWRRILLTCFDQDAITVAEICSLLDCPRPLGQKIVSRLIQESIVHIDKGQRQKKIIDHAKLKQVFEREINHVAKNLARQRGEPTTSQESNSRGALASVENLNQSVSEDVEMAEITSKTAKLPISKSTTAAGNKRKIPTRKSWTPPTSQASADAFQDKAETRGKKAKMSKSAMLNRKK